MFLLISSLTPAEKRYFKLASSIQKGEKAYLELFDTIDKHLASHTNGNGEQLLQRQLEKKDLMKHLAVTKNYLYHCILRTMRTYQAEIDEDKKFRGLMDDLKFLLKKGLYEQCAKKLKRVMTLAIKHERHTELIELAELEDDLLRATFNITELEEKIEGLYNTIFDELKNIENVFQYQLLDSRLSIMNIKYMNIRSEDDKKEYLKIMEHPLLSDESKARTVQAKVIFNILHSVYSHLKGDVKKAFGYDQQLVKLALTNPEVLLKQPRRCIVIFRNHVLTAHAMGKMDEVGQSLDWLKTIKTGSSLMDDLARINGYSLEVYLHIVDKEFEVGYSKIAEVNAEMRRNTALTKELELLNHFGFAKLCFAEGKLTESGKWLQLILTDDAHKDAREDIRTFAKIINLIIHYEKGNQELVESSLKSLYRYLRKKKRLFAFEKLVINFIKKLNRAISEEKFLKLLKAGKKELEEIIKDPYEREALEYFNIMAWIDSKLEDKSYKEMVTA